MSQQYVLLREENDLLNSLIGQSFNQKSKFEAEKILSEIHSKAQDRSIGKMALCYILDNNEIKGVGGSTLLKDKNGKIISNLILNQFGIWLAGLCRFARSTASSKAVKATDGSTQTVTIYDGNVFNSGGGTRGLRLLIGQGTTPPARTDFNIETAFGTAPENGIFNAVSDPIFNSGLGNFKYFAGIIAGGSGTINESIFVSIWRNSVGTLFNFALFRDIISPGQSFIAGQTIALEYTVQL